MVVFCKASHECVGHGNTQNVRHKFISLWAKGGSVDGPWFLLPLVACPLTLHNGGFLPLELSVHENVTLGKKEVLAIVNLCL